MEDYGLGLLSWNSIPLLMIAWFFLANGLASSSASRNGWIETNHLGVLRPESRGLSFKPWMFKFHRGIVFRSICALPHLVSPCLIPILLSIAS